MSENSKWDCTCFNLFLTTDGECTSCHSYFPGCNECSKVSELETDAPLYLKAKYRDIMPYVEEGNYMCSGCSENEEFYNHETRKCQRCDSRIPGCISCAKDSEQYCTECKHGYHLTESGSCYDCLHHDNKCDRCNESKCLDCRPGWTLFFNADYCVPDLF